MVQDRKLPLLFVCSLNSASADVDNSHSCIYVLCLMHVHVYECLLYLHKFMLNPNKYMFCSRYFLWIMAMLLMYLLVI